MKVVDHIESIRRDGAMLADAAERAGLDERVPSCPDWVVRDLVGHQGFVHRWARANLTRNRDDFMEQADAEAAVGPIPDDDGLLPWFREGYALLVETLEDVPDDVVAFTFLPAPNARMFWARRQAHETAIHRADAELASGPVTPYPADHAADGIDELLRGFASRSKRIVLDPVRTLALACTDIDARWFTIIGPDGLVVAEADREPDCTVSGTASDLYLLLWNRGTRGGLSIDGDGDLLDYWKGNLRVRWG